MVRRCSCFILFLILWIRICMRNTAFKVAEYGSNLELDPDLDPQHCYWHRWDKLCVVIDTTEFRLRGVIDTAKFYMTDQIVNGGTLLYYCKTVELQSQVLKIGNCFSEAKFGTPRCQWHCIIKNYHISFNINIESMQFSKMLW